MARCPHDASYIHRHSPYWSVFKQQDANGPFYPSIPDVACWTTWHRVFATPEDFSPSTYKDYVVKLTAGHRGAGTGTVHRWRDVLDDQADRQRRRQLQELPQQVQLFDQQHRPGRRRASAIRRPSASRSTSRANSTSTPSSRASEQGRDGRVRMNDWRQKCWWTGSHEGPQTSLSEQQRPAPGLRPRGAGRASISKTSSQHRHRWEAKLD